MPLIDRTFSDIITFTRASGATYFDSAGVLQSAANDAPRFDYDPVTLAARGMLIEEQRTNNLAYSQEFDNAYWTRVNTTITADAITAPDNTLTAEKLIADATNNFHTVFRAFGFTSGTDYTLSVFAKAGEYQYVTVTAGNPSTFPARVTFDLISGTITDTVVGVGAIQSVGNGWFRCSVTGKAGASASTGCNIAASSTGSYVSYTGDGTSGIYIWGVQLEAGAFPTSYIPTTTAAATRAADVASVNTLAPWFNASEGTLYAEGTAINSIAGATPREYAEFGNAAGTDRIAVEARSATSTRARTVTGGVTTISSDNYDALGKNVKITGAYGSDGITVCVDGRAPITTASAIPTPDTLYLGFNYAASASSVINGHLRRIGYYKRRLSNAQLQAITQ